MNKGLICFWPRFLNSDPRFCAENQDLVLIQGFVLGANLNQEQIAKERFKRLSMGEEGREQRRGIRLLELRFFTVIHILLHPQLLP